MRTEGSCYQNHYSTQLQIRDLCPEGGNSVVQLGESVLCCAQTANNCQLGDVQFIHLALQQAGAQSSSEVVNRRNHKKSSLWNVIVRSHHHPYYTRIHHRTAIISFSFIS